MTEPGFLRDTRDSYDTVAEAYAEHLRDELASKPWDRALLAGFAEVVSAGSAGPIADIGCGPGNVTAHLRALGVDAFGIDLSPGMVDAARRRHPGVRFETGSMTSLALPDASLAGIVAWYSVIHVPDDHLPVVFAEFRRVLAPGGHAMLAFQTAADGHGGLEVRHVTEWLGKPISATAHRRAPGRVAAALTAAGLAIRARVVREPAPYATASGPAPEPTAQAYLLAQRPPQ